MFIRVLHLVIAVGLTVPAAALLALARPVLARRPRTLIRLRGRVLQTWAKAVCRGLNIRVRIQGGPPEHAAKLFIVSNHMSYLDILILASVCPLAFVSKHDVADWPVIGWLAKMVGTIFVNREAKLSSMGLVDSVVEALRCGARVLVFPEGTSTDGQGLLPFKTGLFEAPARAGAVVQPIVLRYAGVNGRPLTPDARDAICWYDGTPFAEHIWRLLGLRGIRVEATFTPPVEPDASRKVLAARIRLTMDRYFRPLITES